MLGAVLVGLGAIGQGYDSQHPDLRLTHASALAASDSFTLLCGIDPASDRRSEFVERFGVPAFHDVEEATDAIPESLVVVATPDSSHLSTVRHILSCGTPTAMLLEKPVGRDARDAEEIEAMIANRNVRTWVNYMRRVDPLWQDALSLVRERDDLTEAICLFFSGDLRHIGCHFVDFLISLGYGEIWVDPRVRSGAAGPSLARLSAGPVQARLMWQESPPTGLFPAEHGVTAMLARKGFEYLETPHGVWLNDLALGRAQEQGQSSLLTNYQELVYQSIHQALQGTETPLATIHDAVLVQRVIDQIYLAMNRRFDER